MAAADPATGAFVWGRPVVPGFEIFSGLVVHDGTLYGQWADCSGRGSGVAAIDMATGRLRWRTPRLFLGEVVSERIVQSVDGGVYLATGSENPHTAPDVVVGIDAVTGKERWRRSGMATAGRDSSVFEMPRSDGSAIDMVARSTGRTVSTLKRTEGTDLGFAFDADRLVVSAAPSPSVPSRMASFDARTSKQVWARDNPVGRVIDAASGTVLTSNGTRGVVAYDEADGRERWRRDDLGPSHSITSGTALFAGADGPGTAAEAVDLGTGKTKWTVPAVDLVAVRANGTFLDGNATDANTGRRLYANSDGHLIGPVPELPVPGENAEVVTPEVGPDGHVYLGRGCPGRG